MALKELLTSITFPFVAALRAGVHTAPHHPKFLKIICPTSFCKVRKYTMERKGEDHLQRTSNNTRDTGVHSMIVEAIKTLSPTIKEVTLATERSSVSFTFKAGQWVDVFIPGVETVGGFSMCSSPQELSSKGRLRLAIKYSTHPPALWMHEKCKVGERINVRVGGDFFMSSANVAKHALLIAGGVGINPLASMVHHVMEGEPAGKRTYLLYSAKSVEELVFRESFDNYCKSNSNFMVKYFVTGEAGVPIDSTSYYESRRINSRDLKDAIDWLIQTSEITLEAKDKMEAFICGPPSMIQETSDILNSLNIKKTYYEKWW